MRKGSGSAAVPLLLAPLVVVCPPSLDDGSAAVQSLLLGVRALVGLVAVQALPHEFGLFLSFRGIREDDIKGYASPERWHNHLGAVSPIVSVRQSRPFHVGCQTTRSRLWTGNVAGQKMHYILSNPSTRTMNRIKVINEPSELVPMLRSVDTPVKRDVLKEVTLEWRTADEIEQSRGQGRHHLLREDEAGRDTLAVQGRRVP